MTTRQQGLRFYLTTGILLLFMSSLQAQTFSDNALLFSRTRPGGSARIQAMGGAQISLGGDYSTALSNPAGLGMYNRSEFTLSLSPNYSTINSTYQGESYSQMNSTFNVPGLSLIFHHDTGKDHGFLGGSFGITMTRTNDFNSKYNYAGDNSQSSIVDYFIDDAAYIAPDNPDDMLYGNNAFYSLTALAYNNYLIEGYDNNGQLQYGSVLSPLPEDVPDPGLPREIRTVRQTEQIHREGGQYQWSIAYGANFSDKLFLGASLGLASFHYIQSQVFTESNLRFDRSPDYNPIDSYTSDESVDLRGKGINLTLGLTYRPVNFLQLGASFVTPTSYQITDSYDAKLSSSWNNFDYDNDPQTSALNDVSEEFDTPLIADYKLVTPLKFSTGATFISKYGLITADAEFVNYQGAKYKSGTDGISYSGDNDEIKSSYVSSINYRIGAEFRYQILRIRGGFNFMSDPYRNPTIDRSIKSISGGLGIKKSKFSVDLAVIQSSTEGKRIPYTVSGLPDPTVSQTIKTTNIILTTGFTF